MLDVEFHPKVDKDIKKFDKPLRKEIRDIHIPTIRQNPFSIGLLHGEWKNIRSYHFKYQGTNYRIVFTVKEKVYIIMINTRENIYKNLKQRLK